MKNLMDCTLRELYELSILTEALVDKVKDISIDEMLAPSCGVEKECCRNCKWYNKGIKNMAYCAMNTESKSNPNEDICDKYE